MRLQLIKFLLWFLSLLPLRLNHMIGAAVGWCAWVLPTASRKATELNLSLCFADKDAAYRRKLARQSLIETGKSLSELGWAWHRPRAELEKLIRKVHGEEHLIAAREKPGGLIVISPHLGAWELCMLPLANEERAIVMYRPPRHPLLEPVLIGGRTRHGGELAPLSPAGIKTVLRGLKQGRAVGILPDQEPDPNNGVFAPFFGVQANTMTLLARMARSASAGMVFIFCERLPKGAGYDLHYLPADEAMRSTDRDLAATALNQCVENCIKLRPEQYIWSYKRFRQCEDGTRRNYRA